MSADALARQIWYGRGVLPATARCILWPFSQLYRAVAALRNAMYDTGLLRAHPAALPVISVGNLSVGGTGKTPFAAHLARRLLEKGARPAILLRGHGRDEPLVHEVLNPGIPVVIDADRVRGVARAREEHGATVVVMDDGFQHRRLRRDADLVLVSADAHVAAHSTLPGGSLREGPSALRRASHIVVSRKAAGDPDAVHQWLDAHAPEVPRLDIHFALSDLRTLQGDVRSLDTLRGAQIHIICSIADPGAFESQLRTLGAVVCGRSFFPDHHDFSGAEASRLADVATRCGMAVCTLKDAVKLNEIWPRAGGALWYVSQCVEVEDGGDFLNRMLDTISRQK